MIQSIVWAGIICASAIGMDFHSSSLQTGNIITYDKPSFIDAKVNMKADTNVHFLMLEGTAKKNWDDHTFHLSTTAYLPSAEAVPAKNKWFSELQYDYQFTERYLFKYMLGYKNDSSSGLQGQFYTGPVLGVNMIDNKDYKFDMRGSIVFNKDNVDEQHADRYLSSKIGAVYTWKEQNNLKFIQEESYRVKLDEADSYAFYSKSTIENKINSKFAFGVSYKIDCVNTPALPSLYTNNMLSASLILRY